MKVVFAFGDSIVDQGNNNHIETVVKYNFEPYGKDFIDGKPVGRFSDSKTPSDLIVDELEIKGYSCGILLTLICRVSLETGN